MPVTVAVTRVACGTSGGTQDITTTDLGGLTPKAAIFILSSATADGSAANHAQMSIGATDGTSQWATTSIIRNGQTTSDVYSRSSNTRVFQILNTTTGALSGDAEFSSWLTNGIRINWTDSIGTAFLFTVVFFAGSDLSVKAGTISASTTDQAEVTTTTTFTPNDVIFSAIGHTAWNNTSDAGAAPQLGMAHNGTSIDQGVVAHQSTDGSSGSVTDGALYTTRIGAILSGGSLSRSYELSAFLSDGFKVKSHGAGAQIFGYLALNYGGKASSYVGTVASPTSTGNAANTAPGFTPNFVTLLSSHLSATGTIQSTSANSLALGFSGFSSTAAFSTAIADEDGSATTDAQSLSDNVPLILPLPDGTNGLVTSTYSLDSTGYTLNYTTVQASGRYMIVWAISTEATTGASAVTLGALTVSAAGTVQTNEVVGSLSKTLDALTSSSAGVVAVAGTSSVTLGPVVSSAAGTVAIAGAATPTLGALTTTATGAVDVVGALAKTLDALSGTATGVIAVAGAADVTLGSLALVAVAINPVVGSAAVTLAALTVSAAGIAPVVGTAAITLGSLSLAAAGGITNNAAAAITLETLTSEAAGAVAVVGEAAITLGAITAAGEGYASADFVGEAAITLGALTSSAVGAVAVVGQATVTLGALVSTSAGAVAVIASANVTLGTLAINAAGVVPVVGGFDKALDALSLTATAQNPVAGSASIPLDALSLVATAGGAPIAGVATISLGVMTLSAAGVITALIAVYGTVHGVTAAGTVEGMFSSGSVKGT